MMTNEANAAENTTPRGYRIAIKAAIRNVLSPNSEIIIMINENTKPCIRDDPNPVGPSASDPSKSNMECNGDNSPSESESS